MKIKLWNQGWQPLELPPKLFLKIQTKSKFLKITSFHIPTLLRQCRTKKYWQWYQKHVKTRTATCNSCIHIKHLIVFAWNNFLISYFILHTISRPFNLTKKKHFHFMLQTSSCLSIFCTFMPHPLCLFVNIKRRKNLHSRSFEFHSVGTFQPWLRAFSMSRQSVIDIVEAA